MYGVSWKKTILKTSIILPCVFFPKNNWNSIFEVHEAMGVILSSPFLLREWDAFSPGKVQSHAYILQKGVWNDYPSDYSKYHAVLSPDIIIPALIFIYFLLFFLISIICYCTHDKTKKTKTNWFRLPSVESNITTASFSVIKWIIMCTCFLEINREMMMMMMMIHKIEWS